MQQNHTHSAAAGLCSECFGFPVVSVAISKRAADGSRRTIPVRCTGCDGTGYARTATPSARVVILSGATS